MPQNLSSQSPTALGVGISVRKSFLAELAQRLTGDDVSLRERLDFVEIVPENFMGRGGIPKRAILEISEALPVTLHGVTLSIGSTDPINYDYLLKLKSLAIETRARWVTDHLCYSSHGGAQFHNLLPLPFTREAVTHVVKRVKEVQKILDLPFGLENPSYYLKMPGAEMTEAQFISEILEKSDCHLLLDVNNVYVNCYNEIGNDPEKVMKASQEFLRQLPLDRLIEVHVAGHKQSFFDAAETKPFLLDTHGAPVGEPVKRLLSLLHEMHPVKSLILERESNVPKLDEVVSEASQIWKKMKMNLKSAQEQMHRAVFESEISDYFADSDPDRVALYRGMTRTGFQDTLDRIFELSRTYFLVTGRVSEWLNLGEKFFSEHPASDFRMNWLAENFSEFASREKLPDWLCELMDYEWLRFKVHSSHEVDRELVAYDYAIPGWYMINAPRVNELSVSDFDILSKKDGCFAVLYRHQETMELRSIEIQAAAFSLLSDWKNGGSLGKSAVEISSKVNRPVEEIEFQIRELTLVLEGHGVTID